MYYEPVCLVAPIVVGLGLVGYFRHFARVGLTVRRARAAESNSRETLLRQVYKGYISGLQESMLDILLW